MKKDIDISKCYQANKDVVEKYRYEDLKLLLAYSAITDGTPIKPKKA